MTSTLSFPPSTHTTRSLLAGLALVCLASSCSTNASTEDAIADTTATTSLVVQPVATSATGDAPPNDTFDGATIIDLAALPFTDSAVTTGATTDNDDESLGCPAPTVNASVWYSVTPNADMRLLVGGIGSDYSVGISVGTRDGDTFDLIECRPFDFVVEAEADVTYYLQAFADEMEGDQSGGDLQFSVQQLPDAPANDRFEDAVVIDPSALPFTDSVDVSGASSDEVDFEVGCPAPATSASVWYSFTPTRDMTLLVNTEGSDFPAGVGVGTGEPGNFGAGECMPDSLEVDVEAGETYHIHVFDGQEDGGGNGGNLELTVQKAP